MLPVGVGNAPTLGTGESITATRPSGSPTAMARPAATLASRGGAAPPVTRPATHSPYRAIGKTNVASMARGQATTKTTAATPTRRREKSR